MWAVDHIFFKVKDDPFCNRNVVYVYSDRYVGRHNPYVAFEGTYKPHCKQIKLSCEAKTILYKSYHTKPLCEGEVIEVDKPVQRGVYAEKFYLNVGTRIETRIKYSNNMSSKSGRNTKTVNK